jgi:protein-tyrosine phosphatase
MTITVLFVCTGNTCRSPMAVGTLRSVVRRAGLEHHFEISAAGTGIRKVGRPPSLLAIEVAARRGYRIADHRSRRLTAGDIAHFAYSLAMDRTHLAAMRAVAPTGFAERPQMFLKFAPALGVRDIVDPSGGTVDDYERALDLIEAGCVGLLTHLRATLEKKAVGSSPTLRRSRDGD